MWGRVRNRILPLIGRRRVALGSDRPLVSFTFDDVPRSACLAGRAILERRGCLGTYYVAGGLTDRLEEGRLCHSRADLKSLAAGGHELGCHTFGHVDLLKARSSTIREDLNRNAEFLADVGADASRLGFSYPFGSVGFRAKRLCSRRFRSCRIIGGAVQTGHADLSGIEGVALYSSRLSLGDVRGLVERAASAGGWLVFYTHDVDENPSPWGATPELLDGAAALAADVGCRLLCVRDALDEILGSGTPA